MATIDPVALRVFVYDQIMARGLPPSLAEIATNFDTSDTVARRELAKAWYGDPRRHDWRPRTRDESQAVIASAGLVGDFWELPR